MILLLFNFCDFVILFWICCCSEDEKTDSKTDSRDDYSDSPEEDETEPCVILFLVDGLLFQTFFWIRDLINASIK